MNTVMTSSRPYLLRAIYEWLLDNQLTPYVLVDATFPEVMVPEEFIENGRIVLNISPRAIINMSMTNEALKFAASFSSRQRQIDVPIQAVLAIYAFENGRGMVFQEDEDGGTDGSGPVPGQPSADTDQKSAPKGRPSLKIVK